MNTEEREFQIRGQCEEMEKLAAGLHEAFSALRDRLATIVLPFETPGEPDMHKAELCPHAEFLRRQNSSIAEATSRLDKLRQAIEL